jgi:hypothetical protein
MTRTDNQLPAANARRPASRRWLAPLLWLLIPALAAVGPWAWHRWRASQPALRRAWPPLALTGDSRRDRQAILERAADLLVAPGTSLAFPDQRRANRAALMGDIGVALLPLDRAKGTQIVERAIEMAIVPADRVTAADLEAPERSQIGMLIRLARSLPPYQDLARTALRAAYAEAQGNRNPVYRVYAMCLFAREAASIDPAWARSAVRQASSGVTFLREPAPADPFAVVAAVVAQVEGRVAARPLVRLALQSIPLTPARPLVEARLAAWLADAAPARARELARQALADVGVQAFGRSGGQAYSVFRSAYPAKSKANSVVRSPYPAKSKAGSPLSDTKYEIRTTPDRARMINQYHDVAVLLAAAHPQVALAAVARLPTPEQRAATLVEMGHASEARAPARAEALYRRALREAEVISESRARQAAVLDAATGLAAYNLATARHAVLALPGPVPGIEVMRLAGRAAQREPAAAIRLASKTAAKMWGGHAPPSGVSEGSGEIDLAEVRTVPDLRLALDLAERENNYGPELQATALLAVAQRLNHRGEAPPAAGPGTLER